MIITWNDFYWPLKISSEDDTLLFLGSAFHSFGAELEKNPTKREILNLETDKEPSVADRKFLLFYLCVSDTGFSKSKCILE